MGMEVTPDTIDEWFREYGWKADREGDDDWRTGFRGDVSDFRIFLKMTENWIYFTIAPFIIAPQSEEVLQHFYLHLLRLNREINLAKFCIDSDGDVVLTVELPTESLDYSEFRDAINTLCYYADDTYLEMINLANIPGAPSRYDDSVNEEVDQILEDLNLEENDEQDERD